MHTGSNVHKVKETKVTSSVYYNVRSQLVVLLHHESRTKCYRQANYKHLMSMGLQSFHA